jgi:hypothetical protein
MPRPRSRAATLLGRALLTLLPTLAILILHALAGEAPLFANFEAQLLNWRFQLRGPVEPGPEVVLITIDDRTVAGLGRWPLSREHMAAAVQRATAAGARVIAFDLLFAEPEIALPADLADAVRAARSALPAEQEDLAQRLDRLLDADDPDRRFAEALRAAGTVLIPYAFTFDAKAPTPGRPTLCRRRSKRRPSRSTACRRMPIRAPTFVPPVCWLRRFACWTRRRGPAMSRWCSTMTAACATNIP